MMQRSVLAMSIAVLSAATWGWAAQAPQGQQPQGQQPRTPTQQREAQEQRGNPQTVTIVGCLQEEKNVPGRQPNVAERAGIGEDFILTNAMIQRQAGAASGGQAGAAASGAPGAAGTTGTTGSAQSQGMYQVTGLDDDQLRPHVGHRVEVMGRVQQARAGTPGQSGSPTTGTTGSQGGQTRGQSGATSDDQRNEDLPRIEATSIKQTSGTCPTPR